MIGERYVGLLLLSFLSCEAFQQFRAHSGAVQSFQISVPPAVGRSDCLHPSHRRMTSLTTAGPSSLINIPPEPVLPPAPESVLPEYKDNPLDKVCIYFLSYFLAVKSARPLECKKMVFVGMNFKDFVALTKTFMRNTSPLAVRQRIVDLLKTVMHPVIRYPFQFLFRHFPRWFCEMCSFFMSLNLMAWLVGPSERFALEVDTADAPASLMKPGELLGRMSENEVSIVADDTSSRSDDGKQLWQSGVKLLECRYLMESGCKANCLHLCKGPTQQFFAQELGIPLYMKPNFEDSSCELQFGVSAPAEEDDPAYKEKCFSNCPATKFKGELTC